MSPPLRLYKYEPLTTRALQNLKSQIIYFGSPLNFNDPYDCALTPNIKTPTDEDIATIRKFHLHNERLPILSRKQLETLRVEQLREKFFQAAHGAVKIETENFLKSGGVACFSESNEDLLMWSHYGGHYKGFCLEFSKPADLFTKIRKVNYQPSLPSIDVATILMNSDIGFIIDTLFCTKSIAWAYEKEWRAIHKVAGTEFGYPAEALTGIYFGPDIDQESLEIICLILAGQNENVRLWKGRRSTTEFQVIFEEFNYASHLEAKRKGLV